MEDRDFIDFKFGDHWASDFNLLAVSSGDRYSPPVYGSVNPNTATIAGKVGVYKWKTQVNEKVFNIKIAFDNINGQILNQIKEWLNPFKIDKLVFKEEPYKYYWVALNTEPKLDFLPFLEETKVVNGIAFKEGVYKGEFELQFVCFDNYGYSDWQSFDENYDYVVKEIEGEEPISFNDGSDNNLIITKIEGNSKQRTREEVTGTVISGSEMTINEEYISNKTQFVIDGNSEQKNYSGKNLFNVNDKYRFSDGVIVDEDDWITVNVDNSEGTTTIYKQIYTNVSQKLKVDTTYTILYEIKEVKNITDGNNITLDLVNGYMSECQFNSGFIQNFNTLLSKKVVISRITTKSDFSNCTTMLRTLVTSKAGTTGSITFRISVLEEEVTENTFVYEPYVGGQPSPNPEYPQDIEVIDGVNRFDIDKKDIIENKWLSYDEQEKTFTIKQGTGVAPAVIPMNINLEIGSTITVSFIMLSGKYTGGVISLGTYHIKPASWQGKIDLPQGEDLAGKTFNSTVTITDTINGFMPFIYGTPTVEEDIVFKIQVTEGTTAKPYLPHGCIGLEQSGKNLLNIFDKNWIVYNGIKQTDGSIKANVQGQYYISIQNPTDYWKNYIMQNKGRTLTLSQKEIIDGYGLGIVIYGERTSTTNGYQSAEGNPNGRYVYLTIADDFTSVSRVELRILRKLPPATFTDTTTIISELQLEVGSTATPYEPYHSPKLYPINLNGNSIAKVGDVKDLLKVYRNGDVEIEKRFEKIVLNGTETIAVYIHDGILSDMYAFYIVNMEGAFTNCKILSSHFIFGPLFNSEESKVYSYTKNVLFFTIPKTIASTVNEVKTYLAEQYANGTPVTIEYELAGPQTIKLPSIEPIELWQGTNNFKLITNLDTTMELTYNYLPAVPSVEEPSEIKNCKDSINTKVQNKNFLDLTKCNFARCTLNKNGSIKSNIENSYFCSIATAELNELLMQNRGEDFTFSTGTDLGHEKQISIVIYGTRKNGSRYQEESIAGSNVTINVSKDFISITHLELRFNRKNTPFTDTATTISYVQFEFGDKATDYIGHEEQTITFPLSEGQKLMLGDYLADDGIHHKRKQIVLDGSDDEDWRINQELDEYISFYLAVEPYTLITPDKFCYCSHFGTMYEWRVASSLNAENLWNHSKTSMGIKIKKSRLTSINVVGFKAWLSENPIKIEYELAEEEIEPYTTEQQIVYDEIKNNLYSYEGTNHIFSTNEVPPLLSISYVPKQDIYIDYVANQSNLLNDSAFYYNNNIYKKSYFDAETGDATKSGISENRPVYLYNAGTTAANLNLTFDMIIPAEGSPLVINTESCKLTDDGIKVLKQISSISISNFSKYKPFLEIYDRTPSNWQIQIDSNLCEIYLKHKTDKTKIISLNKFNDNQSFLSLANCNFVDYSKPFPTLITAISGTALENTVFNKLSVGTSAQNYRLKNVDVEWKHTYL